MRFAIIAAAVSLWLGADTGDWLFYGHDPGGQRFSPLSAINRRNVKTLKIAWTYRTGDAYQPKNRRSTAFEATPLYIDGTLYLSTPPGRIIALDPITGKERWTYDGKVPRDRGYGDFANRGVSAWTSPEGQLRILMATIDARLIAVDAATGKPCQDFGDNGVVDLRAGLRIAPREFSDDEETSPPAVVGNTIVIGSVLPITARPISRAARSAVSTRRQVSSNGPGIRFRGMPKRPGPKRGRMAAPGAQGPPMPGRSSPAQFGFRAHWQSESGLLWRRTAGRQSARQFDRGPADTGRRLWHFQTVHHESVGLRCRVVVPC